MNAVLEPVLKSLEKFVKHNLGEGQLDHSLGRVSKIFIVDGQASEVLQPGERALNDPSFGNHRKLGRTFVRAKNNFHRPSELLCNPVSECSMVATICKYPDKAGKLMLKSLYHLRSTLLS